MGEIILNERAWTEEILRTLYDGKKPGEAIGRIAKYYRQAGYKRNEVHRKIEEFLLRCNPTINLYAWQDSIEFALSLSDKYKLIEIPYVPVTDKELDTISTVSGIRLKRLLFTMICIAKYLNAVNPKNNNWVSTNHRDIFLMANVCAPIKKRSLLINDLYQGGYISCSRIVDNTNIHVDVVDTSGTEILKIDDFRNLGYQYSANTGSGYMQCQCCGIYIKKTGRRQRYCKKCAVGIDNEAITPPKVAV